MDTDIFKYNGFYNNSAALYPWHISDTFYGLGLVILIYMMVVLFVLPNHMRQKQPFKLKGILLIYNTVQVLFSAYLVFLYTRYVLKHGIITRRCPRNDDLLQVIKEIKPYFIAKHLDLLDTVFFVLRKKDNQVTFLHLYHHVAMVSWTWFHLTFHPTDHFVVVGLLNSLVHVLMYAYYGLSSLGPEYSKYLWWKKHLTKVQLVQFILVVSDLYFQQKLSPCPIPDLLHYFCMGSICSFFVLFLKFYFVSYNAKRSAKTCKEKCKKKGKENLE